MPGIFGIISKVSSDKNKGALKLMHDCMLHESFYSSGLYNNEQIGIYAGWICHKDSFCDCMPVWNENKDIVLIFFGENFVDPNLFDQLSANNHLFDKSNASYLIHLYEDKGLDFLQDLNGWFSGLLIDLRNKKVVLFNDRYGMQKIFYHESNDSFYFASEGKALLKILPRLRALDMRGIGEQLCCGCVLENRTLFENVYLLAAASSWIFENGYINKRSYFNPSIWENQPVMEPDIFYDTLKDTFSKILPRYFRSNQKLGISLTGGLDTRMIMANAILPQWEYPCYTFGGMYRDCYDVTISKKVAEICKQTHQVITLDTNFLKNFGHYAAKTVYITDGYLDVSGAPEIYVNNLARNIAAVRLTGNAGGEVLRHIRHMQASNVNDLPYRAELKAQINKARITLNSIKRNSTLSFILFNDMPWHNNHRFVAEQSQLTPRTPFMDNDLTALMYRAPIDILQSPTASLRLISDGNQALANILTDFGVCIKSSLYSKAIKAYRTFSFKAEYAYNYGMPQWLARLDYTFKFMHFEKLFLGRHKFYHFRLWYRDDLADYIKEILLDERTLRRPYLNRSFIETMVHDHTKGFRNHTNEISQLLTLELMQRHLIEN